MLSLQEVVMKFSREKQKRFALFFLMVLLGGCTGFEFEILEKQPQQPTRQAEQSLPKTVPSVGGPGRIADLQQEISKLHQEEQWTQDQINQTALELQGPKLIGKSTRDTVDLGDVGRNSADMTAQYEYKSRIKKKRIALENELSQIEQQALGGGGGGGGGSH